MKLSLSNIFSPLKKKSIIGDELARQFLIGNESKSGADINSTTARMITTVIRCVGVIADSISVPPFVVYLGDGKGGREQDINHPVCRVLSRRPNNFQTSLEYRETIGTHVALTGNAYSFINRVRGQIVELIPITPDRVTVIQNQDLSLTYRVSLKEGKIVDLPQEAIWHIRGPSWNGWEGRSPLKEGMEAMGLAVAMESSHARLHKHGVRPSGVYSVDGALSDVQYKQIRAMLDAQMAGYDNTGKPMILDQSAKFVSTAMTGVDAQHLESRKFQIEEICRLFGVLPIMVGYSDKATTYASAEQQYLAHAINTAHVWQRRFCESVDRWLLTEPEQDQGYYSEFTGSLLMYASAKDRAEYLASATNAGYMTLNEAREMENSDRVEGLDKFILPMNMAIFDPKTGSAMPIGGDQQATKPGAPPDVSK